MVTAGGDGKIIQQGWRALDCGVLGVLLVTCLASWGPIMACHGHGAAGSRGMLHVGEKGQSMVPVACESPSLTVSGWRREVLL